LFGREKAWSDGIDAHAASGPFTSEKLGEIQHGGFGGGIGDDARDREMTGDAGNINDAAATALDHAWTEFLAGKQYAANEVEIEIGAPIVEGDLFE